MNWADPQLDSSGLLPAVAALDHHGRVELLRQGLNWSAQQNGPNPAGSHRVAELVMQAMDAYALEHAGLRAFAAVLIGSAAFQLDRPAEAELHLRQVLDGSPVPETRVARIEAKIILGGVVMARDPEEGVRLLRSGIAEAKKDGQHLLATSGATSLGSALRKAKQFADARRVFEQALSDAEASGDLATIASLHGNLGNLLTDNLGQHREAIEHYRKAVAAFDGAGHEGWAARRFFNLISSAIAGCEYGVAMEALQDFRLRLEAGSKGLVRLLAECAYLDVPVEFRDGFQQLLEAAADDTTLQIDPETRAAILAACFLLEGMKENHRKLLVLARDERLRHLKEDTLQYGIYEMLQGACAALQTIGVLAALPYTLLRLPPEKRFTVKGLNFADEAYLLLSGFVERIRAGGISCEEAETELRGRGIIFGVAYTDEDPPSWTGMSDEEGRGIFLRLRRACCPEVDTIREDSWQVLQSGIDAAHRGELALAEDRFREAIRMFDLLGWPDQQIATRLTLAERLLFPGVALTEDRYAEILRLLKIARELAEGLPDQSLRVGSLTGRALKEAGFGNEPQRLNEAIAILRDSFALARTNNITDSTAELGINLANALVDNPARTAADLSEAERILEATIADCGQKGTSHRNVLAVAHNSLGTLRFQRFQRQHTVDDLHQAIVSFREARKIRWELHDVHSYLRASINLIGAGMYAAAEQPDIRRHVIDIAHDLRRKALLASDPEVRAGALTNAAMVLSKAGSSVATLVSRDAVRAASSLGTRRAAIIAYASAAQVHLRYKEYGRARDLCEQTIEVLGRFRQEGGDPRYRASLSNEFASIFDELYQALTALRASAEERWWALERKLARTLAENIGLLPGAGGAKHEILDALRGVLSPADCVVQVFGADDAVFAIAIRSRSDTLDIRFGAAMPSAAFGWPNTEEIHLWDEGQLRERLAGPARLLRPFIEDASGARIRRLIVSAESQFGTIPWHAIPLGSQPGVIGDIMDVLETPSATVLASLAQLAHTPLRRAVLVAVDPTGGLRSHIDEARAAFARLGCPEKIVLTDRSRPVTVRAVLEQLQGADLFHFAGHGTFVDGSAADTGLLLSDAILSVDSLGRIGGGRGPAIVFLSACHSARSETGVENMGLLQSFLGSGAGVAIGAVGQAPDAVAATLADRFYERLPALGAVGALCESRRSLGHQGALFKVAGWDSSSYGGNLP